MYVAKVPLFVGTARAHNPGDSVPEANLETNGWGEDEVEQVEDPEVAEPEQVEQALVEPVEPAKAKAKKSDKG